MSLHRIAKSSLSKVSRRRGNPIVAHLSSEGRQEPLCQTSIAAKARWLDELDPLYAAVRDCRNCQILAERMGVR